MNARLAAVYVGEAPTAVSKIGRMSFPLRKPRGVNEVGQRKEGEEFTAAFL